MLNGTVFVVTDEPDSIPDRARMTSTAVNIANGPEAVAARQPTDRELRVVSTDEARKLFGTSAELIDGITVRAPTLSLLNLSQAMASVACQRPASIVCVFRTPFSQVANWFC